MSNFSLPLCAFAPLPHWLECRLSPNVLVGGITLMGPAPLFRVSPVPECLSWGNHSNGVSPHILAPPSPASPLLPSRLCLSNISTAIIGLKTQANFSFKFLVLSFEFWVSQKFEPNLQRPKSKNRENWENFYSFHINELRATSDERRVIFSTHLCMFAQ